MVKRAIIVGLALTLLPYCSAVAQAQSNPLAQHALSEAVDVDDVIVNGQSIRINADSFVSAVAAPPIGRKAATWKDRICVGAIGFAPEPATAIVDRILDWSHSFGVRVGASGCTPNVFVVATDNGAQTAKTSSGCAQTPLTSVRRALIVAVLRFVLFRTPPVPSGGGTPACRQTPTPADRSSACEISRHLRR